ncbi:hypothetical protein [Gimesia aquarii]|uniref:PepSY domain-containing protein n=1 Tax=Gimesia aquarii TaxID=2527964 RepID=A0A517X2V8_9PLAN|nr:hypothetical protein [Gimesia aquarii]QDU11839.1 hypothetical protein V202x_52640 [Gimesia aquarii]
MVRVQFACVLLLGISLIVGCGRPATQSAPTSSTPKDPEEAALRTVATIYGFCAMKHKTGPKGWEVLEEHASSLSSPAREKALDAIKKLQLLGYKVTWGIDMLTLVQQEKDPNEFIIIESPDGRLKAPFSGNKIIKEEVDQKKPTSDTENSDSGAPK